MNQNLEAVAWLGQEALANSPHVYRSSATYQPNAASDMQTAPAIIRAIALVL
jgi:hypothetical protein